MTGTHFHNPYNFVPFDPPRRTGHPDLGDAQTADRLPGHDRYQHGRFTGRLRVELECASPLLIVDPTTRRRHGKDHPVYDVRLDGSGRPRLAETSVKGALRSAYEAVTNSRMGVFDGHDKPLSYRRDATTGAAVVPARIEKAPDGGLKAQQLLGFGSLDEEAGGRRLRVLPAAWLPYYGGDAGLFGDHARPEHGDRVEAWVEKFVHRSGRFVLWQARAVAPEGQLGPERPPPTGSHGHPGNYEPCGVPVERVRGWACVTGRNAENKHDERIFFTKGHYPPAAVPIDPEWADRWRGVIDSYDREAPIDEGIERSRHVDNNDDRELHDGMLVYAVVDEQTRKITDLLPVTISRSLYRVAPRDLVPPSVLPASSLSELSPADRVFGWVHPQGEGAYAGHVRISNVRCTSDHPVEQLAAGDDDPGAALAILGQPKPSQGRFYASGSPTGEPLPRDRPKDRTFEKANDEDGGLRGRKVYITHPPRDPQWWRPRSGKVQEHLHPTGDRTNQNRSVTAWVRQGTRFELDVIVDNLTAVELGALVWLLDLERHQPGARLRLGGGKPLGFGAVTPRIVDGWLETGEQRAAWYASPHPRSVHDHAHVTDDASLRSRLDETVTAFHAANEQAADADAGQFEQITYISAFLRAAVGYDDGHPVHYPRPEPVADRNDPDRTAIYQWFGANEDRSAQLALPDLIDGQPLPYQPRRRR